MLIFITGATLWAKALGGANGDIDARAVLASDSTYAVAWTTSGSTGSGGYDVALALFSLEGTLLWAKAYGTSGGESLMGILKTSDGFLLTASARGSGTEDADFLLIKVSADGSLEWAKLYGDTSENIPRALAPSPDGDFFMVGHTITEDKAEEAMVVKVGPDGTLRWAKAIGNEWTQEAYGALTSGGQLVFTGVTNGSSYTYTDWVCSISTSTGSVLWSKRFGNDTKFEFGRRGVRKQNELWLSGDIEGSNGEYQVMLLRTDTLGNLLSCVSFGDTSDEYTWGLSENYIGCMTFTPDTNFDIVIAELDSEGTPLWFSRFGGDEGESVDGIVEGPEGTILVVGDTRSYGIENQHNILVARVDTSGNYPGCFEAYDLPMDTLGVRESPVVVSSTDLDVVTQDIQLNALNASLNVEEACDPYQGSAELAPKFGVRVYLWKEGLEFALASPALVELYSASGRLVKALRLGPGRSRVALKPGVYIWRAGELSGKAAVR